MNFGDALEIVKRGQTVCRTNWIDWKRTDGKSPFAFIYLVPAASYPAQTGAAKAHFGDQAMVPYNAYIAFKNGDDKVSTWAPTVDDVLAEDWGQVIL